MIGIFVHRKLNLAVHQKSSLTVCITLLTHIHGHFISIIPKIRIRYFNYSEVFIHEVEVLATSLVYLSIPN